jgi:hypothetical protein
MLIIYILDHYYLQLQAFENRTCSNYRVYLGEQYEILNNDTHECLHVTPLVVLARKKYYFSKAFFTNDFSFFLTVA